MKNSSLILLVLIILSCSAGKTNLKQDNTPIYKIVSVPVIHGTDTTYINELRFYKIYSAKDAERLMNKNYGKGDKKISGKYQANMNRIIWHNIKLFTDSNQKYTVITDGMETMISYFTSLMVFDSTGIDCFKPNHPNREKLINLFSDKLKKVKEYSPFHPF